MNARKLCVVVALLGGCAWGTAQAAAASSTAYIDWSSLRWIGVDINNSGTVPSILDDDVTFGGDHSYAYAYSWSPYLAASDYDDSWGDDPFLPGTSTLAVSGLGTASSGTPNAVRSGMQTATAQAGQSNGSDSSGSSDSYRSLNFTVSGSGLLVFLVDVGSQALGDGIPSEGGVYSGASASLSLSTFDYIGLSNFGTSNYASLISYAWYDSESQTWGNEVKNKVLAVAAVVSDGQSGSLSGGVSASAQTGEIPYPPIPLPAALWLFASAMGFIPLLRRRVC